MVKNIKQIDFRNQELEHCCICGKALSEEDAIIDEHDEAWCPECLHEALTMYKNLSEQMKAEKRNRNGR